MMMRYSITILALFAVAFGPFQTDAACGTDDEDDIVSLACDSDNEDTLGTLCDLLRSTGLDSTLDPSGDFFVFAPTNAAFTAAGDRAGVSINQQQAVLKYHVAIGDTDIECGGIRDSLLIINGRTQQTITRCEGFSLAGQQGNVRLPTPATNYPRFTDLPSSASSSSTDSDSGASSNSADNRDNDDFIQACNGKIAIIDNVLGFSTAQYNYGRFVAAPISCSFNARNCKGFKKGPTVVVSQETVDGTVFQSVYFRKGAKKGRWGNLASYQSIYAYDAQSLFAPFYGGYGGYGGYGPKNAKKGYGNGYGYGYGYGYGGLRGKGHKRDRYLAASEPDSFAEAPKSAYEPSEYYGSEAEYEEIDMSQPMEEREPGGYEEILYWTEPEQKQ